MATSKKEIIEKEKRANMAACILIIILLGSTLLLVLGGLFSHEPEQVKVDEPSNLIVDDIPLKNYEK